MGTKALNSIFFVALLFVVGLVPELVSAAEIDNRQPPAPFEKWRAGTKKQKQLDNFITEVVNELKKDSSKFASDQWKIRNIKNRYRELRFKIPVTYYGKYSGRSFLFSNEEFEKYFHTEFKSSKIEFFVPSACYDTIALSDDRGIAKLGFEGVPILSSHGDSSKWPDLVKKRLIPFYEINCGSGVKMRLYDSALFHAREDGLKGRIAKQDKIDYKSNWVGIALFYPANS